MNVFDGTIQDVSDFTTDKFLKVNSCGFQHPDRGYTVMRKNGRQDWHILLISKGTCLTLHNEKLHTMSAGNMVIYAPKEEQMYSYKTESSSLWCHFTGTIIDELFKSTDIKSGVYSIGNSKAIFDSFSNLIRIFHLPGRENFSNSCLLELVYNISDGIKNPHQNKSTDSLLSVLSYINENYSKTITIEELAKKAGYSKSRKVFHRRIIASCCMKNKRTESLYGTLEEINAAGSRHQMPASRCIYLFKNVFVHMSIF